MAPNPKLVPQPSIQNLLQTLLPELLLQLSPAGPQTLKPSSELIQKALSLLQGASSTGSLSSLLPSIPPIQTPPNSKSKKSKIPSWLKTLGKVSQPLVNSALSGLLVELGIPPAVSSPILSAGEDLLAPLIEGLL